MSDKQTAEFDYTLTNAEDDALMTALRDHQENWRTYTDDDFRAVVAALIAPHAARAQAHYAAFVGAEAELARLRADWVTPCGRCSECQRGQSCTSEEDGHA